MKNKMELLPPKRQRAICTCKERCEDFLTIIGRDEDFMLCAGEAKQFGFEILEQLGLLTKAQAFPKSKYGWTTEQERFIKKYLEDNNAMEPDGKLKYGVCALMGEMLGKSRGQVKNKIQHMRREGKL